MTTLTAFYDLQRGPVSFDYLPFLVRAMLERDRRGCSGLHVVLEPNEGGRAGFARHWGEHDDADTLWRFWHIVVASCPLARSTVSISPTRAHANAQQGMTREFWRPAEKRFYLVGPLVAAARAGETIPRLEATPAARRVVDRWLAGETRTLITLTLRRQATDPQRNTDEAEMRAVASYFSGCGARVEIVDDTMRALEEGRGYAELDPDLRLALYERASLNIIGNNGPSVLLHFSGAPFLQFSVGQPAAAWRDHYREQLLLDWGAQLPWSSPRQRLVWESLPATRLIREAERILEGRA